MDISNDNLKAIEEIYRALSSISNKLDYGLIEEVEEYVPNSFRNLRTDAEYWKNICEKLIYG